MRKLVLAFGILAGVVSVGMGAMSDDEWQRAKHNCIVNKDKNACQALINDGLVSVEQCDKSNCAYVGAVYYQAGRYREAIPYFEKVAALGDNGGYVMLGFIYHTSLQDYYNAKKYYEIGCNKGNGHLSQAELSQAEGCFNLGLIYHNGKGVRQDYAKAHEIWAKACDMKNGDACNNLGVLYIEGRGVRQNLSTAKQYYGKACDLGNQTGCDNYKLLNSQGVR